MTNTIANAFRALGTLLIGGTISFLLINWLNGGQWGWKSLSVITFVAIGCLMGGFEKDKDDADATEAGLGKGFLYGILVFLAVAAATKLFALPVWAFAIGTGIACMTVSTSATHKPEK